MQTHILALSTETPPLSQPQGEVAEKIIKSLSLKGHKAHILRKIFDGSRIEKRHSVVEDYGNALLEGSFFGHAFPDSAPGMTQRNEVYKKEAPKLAHAAAIKAIKQWGGLLGDITHIISVSCTGLVAPGIEFTLIDSLGLPRSTERLGINFMGCFGAFKGLAVAKSIARENPANRVLLVCTELCTLHFHFDGEIDTVVANAIFADGSAAAIVGCDPTPDEQPLMEIVRQSSLALEGSLSHMTWEASDRGLVMRLSSEVPKLIDRHITVFAKSLLGPDLDFASCDWVLHPGGKAILEAVEKTCGLEESQTEISWDVMKNYGNMSSVTILFVLEAQSQKATSREWSIGIGFGPGLSMEGMLFRRSHR